MKLLTLAKIQSSTKFTLSQKDLATAVGDDLIAQGYRVVRKEWDERGNLTIEAVREEKPIVNGKNVMKDDLTTFPKTVRTS